MTTGHEFTFTVHGGDRATENARALLLAQADVVRVSIIKCGDKQILSALYVHPQDDDANLSKMRAGLDSVSAAVAKSRKVVAGSVRFVTLKD